jgi:NADH-quinone oxidoreductase subunit K
MTPLHLCLLIATGLFSIGLVGALARNNTILVLLGVELMLNAANLSFVGFWRYGASTRGAADGIVFVLFAIAVAAAEAAVGLALIIAIYRHQRNIRLQEADRLKG